MNEHSHPTHEHGDSRLRIAFIGFALIAAFFLLFEHRAHVVAYLPFLLLAACPLMHLFGHGHGGHGAHGSGPETRESPPLQSPNGSGAGAIAATDHSDHRYPKDPS